jgi:hypothetical protein
MLLGGGLQAADSRPDEHADFIDVCFGEVNPSRAAPARPHARQIARIGPCAGFPSARKGGQGIEALTSAAIACGGGIKTDLFNAARRR